MRVRAKPTIAATLTLCAACSGAYADGLASLRDAISEAKPIFDTRLRFEGVDQAPTANDAEATTWRARLGFETGKA